MWGKLEHGKGESGLAGKEFGNLLGDQSRLPEWGMCQ